MAHEPIHSIIKPCPENCESAYQDARYGAGNRVFNVRQGKAPGTRCTVCGTEA